MKSQRELTESFDNLEAIILAIKEGRMSLEEGAAGTLRGVQRKISRQQRKIDAKQVSGASRKEASPLGCTAGL